MFVQGQVHVPFQSAGGSRGQVEHAAYLLHAHGIDDGTFNDDVDIHDMGSSEPERRARAGV